MQFPTRKTHGDEGCTVEVDLGGSLGSSVEVIEAVKNLTVLVVMEKRGPGPEHRPQADRDFLKRPDRP